MITIQMPVRFFAGEGCVAANKEVFSGTGSACLIVTGRSAAKKSGALRDVTALFEALGIRSHIFSGVRENPTVESCRAAGEEGASFGADFVLGIGGGSAMDAAKAVSVFAANPGLSEAAFYEKAWDNPPLPILLIGTSAGTGSEVTDVSVLTDQKGRKHSIHDPRLFAAAAFGDWRYTCSQPEKTTVSAALDILCHAAESYFSKKAHTLSRIYAASAIRMAFGVLFTAFGTADAQKALSDQDREVLYEASILAGLAINVTGTCFPHNVGYYLTEKYHVAHGFACAEFLPDLMRHAEQTDPALYGRFQEETGLERGDFSKLLSCTLPAFGFRLSEEEIGGILPRWENNNSVKNTIGTVDTEMIRGFLGKAF